MTTERTSERAIRESLDEAEWRIDPIHDDEDRIVEYALVAVSPGAQRVVATVPYRAYAEWLVERLNGLTRLAGTTPKMLRETLSACQSLVAESPLDQDKARARIGHLEWLIAYHTARDAPVDSGTLRHE